MSLNGRMMFTTPKGFDAIERTHQNVEYDSICWFGKYLPERPLTLSRERIIVFRYFLVHFFERNG